MKNLKSKNRKSNIQFNTNRHIPENKDNLDSREGEEQIFKGEHVTHNTKERKTEHLKKRK
ncbi:MAG TPA: hypothetical protein PLU37_13280 [Chitinophagaceae bacterium]|nr:hypothetical protein [Chitinophagales bacterium]HPG12499.1 hypothetical protein [Chitinophagaceae bacterium]